MPESGKYEAMEWESSEGSFIIGVFGVVSAGCSAIADGKVYVDKSIGNLKRC